MVTNEELDAAIIKEIKREPMFAALLERNIAEDLNARPDDLIRPINRALQRLRKAGKIELTGKPRRWRLVDP